MSNYNLSDSFYKKLKAGKAERASVPFSLQKTHMIDNSTSRVLVKIDPVFHNRLNEEIASVSFAKIGVRYLPNSLHKASNTDNSLFGAFVAKNNETMSMADAKEMASAGTMSQVSDTVFQDENDHIWSVIKEGDTAYLVKQQDEDINSLLAAVHSRAIATASHSVSMYEDYGPGSPVLFYNRNKEELAFGLGVNGETVFVPEYNKIMEVASEFVVSVWDGNTVPTNEIATASADKAQLLEYMTMLYGHNKEFLSEIRDIIYNGVNV